MTCLLKPFDHFKVEEKADDIFGNNTLRVLAWVDFEFEVILVAFAASSFFSIQCTRWSANLTNLVIKSWSALPVSLHTARMYCTGAPF